MNGILEEEILILQMLEEWNSPGTWRKGYLNLDLHTLQSDLIDHKSQLLQHRKLCIMCVNLNSELSRILGIPIASKNHSLRMVVSSALPRLRYYALGAWTDYLLQDHPPWCQSNPQMSGGKQRRPLDTIYPLYGHEVGHEPATSRAFVPRMTGTFDLPLCTSRASTGISSRIRPRL